MVQPPSQRPLPKTSQATRQEEALGRWEGGRFAFDSPEAETAWHRRAYTQGVHPQEWHRGREVDADTARLVEGGLAGATPPYYRGPDGTPRFGNQHTIEPPAQRALRQQAFAGKTLDQIADIHRSTGKFPGEDEAATLTPRNDNQSPQGRPDPATVSAHSAAILAGMQHARETAPIILAKTAQATIPGKAPPPANDASPEPLLPTGDGHGRMPKGPAPLRNYAETPEPVPHELAIGQPVAGKADWPIIAQDWVTTDREGNSVLTEKASQELDRYKEMMLEETNEYTKFTRTKSPGLTADAGTFMRHYLEGNGTPVELAPTPELLQGANIRSANEALNNHILEWLTNPYKTRQPSEQIVPNIQALKDGESITVKSKWDGATGSDTGLNSFDISQMIKSPAHFAALGHVQVHGDTVATVTRRGEHYFITVDVIKQLKDIYDFTDDDGQWQTNLFLELQNLMKSGDRRPFTKQDFEMLNIAAATGRAKPFAVSSAPWNERFTAEMEKTVPNPRIPGRQSFRIVPGTAKWTLAPKDSSERSPHE